MFPIERLLPELRQTLAQHQCIVLEAPPGAGKTTLVPGAVERIVAATASEVGQVVITEPRRLAARLAAKYVAAQRGSALGEEVGYTVRFENKSSEHTRIRFVTEGVLVRRLRTEPDLEGVAAVVLDEFHERHLDTDLLLALLKRVAGRRPEFRLVVMSATLDAEPVARFLGDCPRLRAEGRGFPLTVEHQKDDGRPLEKRVSSAARQALDETDGNVLVFLPGEREIRNAERALKSIVAGGVKVLTLHGNQSLAAQAQAVSEERGRKVVLATNVAESSVTVAGVTAVVDSGLARIARHSPWTGRQVLELSTISQSSAVQRAGRAGRVAPGHVIRLFSEIEFKQRPAFDLPHIAREDLTQLTLQLLASGLRPTALDWLTDPPEPALRAALSLLEELGALADDGSLNPLGQRMASLPAPPRSARLIVFGEQNGIADECALAAALLGERDIRPDHRHEGDLETSESDLQERVDRYLEAQECSFDASTLRAMGVDRSRIHTVKRAYEQLRRIARDRVQGPPKPGTIESLLRRGLLTAFPDRLARRSGKQRLTLINGSQATLSEASVVKTGELLLALDVDERRSLVNTRGKQSNFVASSGAGTVRLACTVDPNWVFDHYSDRVVVRTEFTFNDSKERLECVERLMLGSVCLEEERAEPSPGKEAGEALSRVAQARIATIFGKDSTVEALIERLKLVHKHCGPLSVADGLLSLPNLLHLACEHCTNFEQLRTYDYEQRLSAELSPAQSRFLREEVPTSITLPQGRKLDVHYEIGKEPWVQSRLQDFFGQAEGPRICRDKLPLTIHLLAPNYRAAQITKDLSGFWERHYSDVRKELRRRYPRHAWPEDGRSASPPERRPRKRQR